MDFFSNASDTFSFDASFSNTFDPQQFQTSFPSQQLVSPSTLPQHQQPQFPIPPLHTPQHQQPQYPITPPPSQHQQQQPTSQETNLFDF